MQVCALLCRKTAASAPCPHTGLWKLRLPVLQTWGMVAVHEVWGEEGPAVSVHRTGLLALLQWCVRFVSGLTTQLCRLGGQLCQVIQLQTSGRCQLAGVRARLQSGGWIGTQEPDSDEEFWEHSRAHPPLAAAQEAALADPQRGIVSMCLSPRRAVRSMHHLA